MKVSDLIDSCCNFLVLFVLSITTFCWCHFVILTLLSINNVAFTIYIDQKQQIVGTFFNSLECCPSTKYLCAKVNDPELGGCIQLFFIKVQGLRVGIKQEILALCLMAFSVWFIKKKYLFIDKFWSAKHFADAQYKPNTVATSLRMLFAYFRDNDINYSLYRDFNKKGLFWFDWCLHFYVLFCAFNCIVPFNLIATASIFAILTKLSSNNAAIHIIGKFPA